MRKLKGRDERKQTLDTFLKHSLRVSLPGNQVSSVNTITVILISIFTKGDCPRKRGLRPPHNVVDAASHQAGGSLTCRRATNCSKGPAHRNTSVVHSRTNHKDLSLACSLTQELIWHSHFTKLLLKPKDMINKLLYGLEVFLGVYKMSWDSSKLQMAGGAHIYRSPSQTNRL